MNNPSASGLPIDPSARRDLFKVMSMIGETWGHVLFRGVYKPGSDANFSLAIDKLRRWVRFLVYDSMNTVPFRSRVLRGELSITEKDPQNNDLLWKMFSLEVVEDESVLRIDDPEWYLDEQGLPTKLREHFKDWVASKGIKLSDEDEDPHHLYNDFLVVDAASMASLLEMPEPPQPRPCFNMQEWDSLRQTGTPPAFVWVIDAHLLKNKPLYLEETPNWAESTKEQCNAIGPSTVEFDRCVIKLEVPGVRDAFFERTVLNHPQRYGLPCEEKPKGSGNWVYRKWLRDY